MAGGLAATLQVKYTSSPSFNRRGLRDRPRVAFTCGGSEVDERISLSGVQCGE